MTTEKYSKDEFYQALLAIAPFQEEGLVMGEWCYQLNLGKARLSIRSSCDSSGFARDTADDSIRFVLIANTNTVHKVLTKNETIYTTRLPGWQDRIKKKIEYAISLRQQAGDCRVCGEPLVINKISKQGKNFGKTVAWCPVSFDHKMWVEINLSLPTRPISGMVVSQPALIVEENKVRDFPIERKPVENNAFTVKKPLSSNVKESESTIEPVKKPSVWLSAAEEKKVVVDTANYLLNIEQDLSMLNPQQLEVVKNAGLGICVIDSVPGAGKTRCVVESVVYMLTHGVHPSKIGCFTFSNKAASEMRVRIAKKIWPNISKEELKFFESGRSDTESPLDENGFDEEWVNADPIRVFLCKWVCTIHALSYRLLKEWYGPSKKMMVLAGIPKMRMEADTLIKDSLLELKWRAASKSVKSYIGAAISNLISTYDAENYFYKVITTMGGPSHRSSDLAEIYRRYITFMKKNNLLDFEMMQAEVVRLIRTDKSFVEKVSSMFERILVDESMDTNGTQTEILFEMASIFKNLSYIGDADQLLYAWRGAVPSVMTTKFDEYWGVDNVNRFNLPINYRSTKKIIGSTAKFIESNYNDNNRQYLKKFHWKEDADEGVDIELDQFDMFSSLTQTAVEKIAESKDPGSWFVLSRTRAECEQIHTALVEAGIPAINKSGGMLFGSAHIQKVIAYAQLAIDYNGARDNLEILSMVANVATKSFVSSINRRRHLQSCNNDKPWIDCGCPLIVKEGVDHTHTRYYGKESIAMAGNWDGIEKQQYETNRGGYPTMRAKGARDLVGFVNSMTTYTTANTLLRYIVDEAVYPWLKGEEGITDEDMSENKSEDFQVLMSICSDEMTTEEFLKEIDRLTKSASGKNDDEAVLIGTVHWSKGAERPRVILNTTRMPIVPPYNSDPEQLITSRPATIEEERNIAYVGATRAKEELYVYCSKEWLGKPVESQFWNELKDIVSPKRDMDKIDSLLQDEMFMAEDNDMED